MSALSELLNRHFAEKYPNTSNRKIAAEAGVSRGTIDNYRNGTHPAAPSDEVLTAFHKLLGIPMGELREAANLPVGEDAPYVPPREANLLSLRQRRAVDEMIRSIVETRGASSHDTDQPASDADRPPASGTPRGAEQGEKTARVVHIKRDDLNEQQSSPEAEPEPLPEELPEDAWAARKRDPRFKPDIPSADHIGEENQDDNADGMEGPE